MSVKSFKKTLLVKVLIIYFDFNVSLELIGHEELGHSDLLELVVRIVYAPHENSHERLSFAEDLLLLELDAHFVLGLLFEIGDTTHVYA